MAGMEEALGERGDILQLYGSSFHERHQLMIGEQNLADPPEVFWQAKEPTLESAFDFPRFIGFWR